MSKKIVKFAPNKRSKSENDRLTAKITVKAEKTLRTPE